jgi:transcription elongation factor GreB
MVHRRIGSGPRSKQITPEGMKRLKKELDQLWTGERPKVVQEVADAAALGDRSENAEYIYGKKRLREIDKRIEFLSHRIEELQVVHPTPGPGGRIAFGAWVELEDDDGAAVEYRLVGPDEFDPAAGLISVDSPVGQALMGKRLDDEVVVHRPKGEIAYTVTGVRYGAKQEKGRNP